MCGHLWRREVVLGFWQQHALPIDLRAVQYVAQRAGQIPYRRSRQTVDLLPMPMATIVYWQIGPHSPGQGLAGMPTLLVSQVVVVEGDLEGRPCLGQMCCLTS